MFTDDTSPLVSLYSSLISHHALKNIFQLSESGSSSDDDDDDEDDDGGKKSDLNQPEDDEADEDKKNI
jgi:hypothetical protein